MVEHDGHGSQLPTADASGFLELSQSSFGVSCGELDRRALHGVTRRRFQGGHVFVIESTRQLVGNAGLLFGIRRPVFPYATDEAAGAAGEPVAVAGVAEKPVAIHGGIVWGRTGERRGAKYWR